MPPDLSGIGVLLFDSFIGGTSLVSYVFNFVYFLGYLLQLEDVLKVVQIFNVCIG